MIKVTEKFFWMKRNRKLNLILINVNYSYRKSGCSKNDYARDQAVDKMILFPAIDPEPSSIRQRLVKIFTKDEKTGHKE